MSIWSDNCKKNIVCNAAVSCYLKLLLYQLKKKKKGVSPSLSGTHFSEKDSHPPYTA